MVYFCMYCQDNYCNDCMAYTNYFDLQELETILMSVPGSGGPVAQMDWVNLK